MEWSVRNMAKKIPSDKQDKTQAAPPEEPKAAVPTEDQHPEPNGAAPNGADLPTPGPGGLGSFARFVASDTVETVPQEQVFACSVGRPDRTDYFRAHPDKSWWQVLFTLEAKDAAGQRKIYVIDPSLRALPELEGHIKRRMMVPYMTIAGSLGLWPISVDSSDNKYVVTAQRICAQAVDTWMLCTSKREIGEYRGRPSDSAHPDPKWPKMDVWQLLELAFPPESRILDRTHPVLAKLRGEWT
jgi:hypothetical protein